MHGSMAEAQQEDPDPRKARIPRWLLGAGLLAALAWFVIGIQWGLPSRRADPYLFGPGREPWSGRQIIELIGPTAADPNRGADVDVNPVTLRDRPVILNEADAQRAEIVRRYRLYSYQPDEMITFNALRQMDPGGRRFDPKLYQYGGLWVYPVGALLKLASVAGLVSLRADVGHYLDNPHEFGRFYVVARLYSALWGVVGVWAVYQLVRKIAGCPLASAIAAACFAAMPVVVNMAHEAKPHLPGAVLMLLAVLAAATYVQSGKAGWWITAGALCGAAFGMVVSSLPIFVILPLMALLRRQSWRNRIVVVVAAGVVAVDVYFVTNPYVLVHLIRRDPVLTSNLGNSAAMYRPGGSVDAVVNAAKLIAEGTSPLLAMAGVTGAIVLGYRAWRMRKGSSPEEVARRAAGLLLAAPAVLVLVQFVALAAGKPGEYGRFAILPDTFLAIEAVVAAVTFAGSVSVRRLTLGALFVTTAVCGAMYLRQFISDSAETTSRLRAAAELAQLPPSEVIAVEAEPAPYSLPPVNLFTHPIVLLPRGAGAAGALESRAILVRPVDVPVPMVHDGVRRPLPRSALMGQRAFPARISWAGKTFEAAICAPSAGGAGPTPSSTPPSPDGSGEGAAGRHAP
jgi:hypothetical protein